MNKKNPKITSKQALMSIAKHADPKEARTRLSTLTSDDLDRIGILQADFDDTLKLVARRAYRQLREKDQIRNLPDVLVDEDNKGE